MAGRPPQPKCPHCDKALYKRMDPGQVKKSDPYAWCRNKTCEVYNDAQTAHTRFAPLGAETIVVPKAKAKKPKKPKKPKLKLEWPTPRNADDSKRMQLVDNMADGAARLEAHESLLATIRISQKASEAAILVPDMADDALAVALIAATADATESAHVAKARKRIRAVMDAAESQFGSQAIGLALAIVTQETGNNSAANLLIGEYDLADLGIEPRSC